jgi:mono/diheme cytochrome c family protein
MRWNLLPAASAFGMCKRPSTLAQEQKSRGSWAVIVFDRKDTLTLTYKQTTAKRKKDPMFALKAILLYTALAAVLGISRAQEKSDQKHRARQPNTLSGKETFLKYCASCHGEDAKGKGPASIALKPQPSDLTTLARRHDGKYPLGYVAAVVKFGRNVAAHLSDDIPVWGSRFRDLDTTKDPTGQLHVDDVVAYIESLQAK